MGGMTALNVATMRLFFTLTNALGTDIKNYKDYKGDYSKVGMGGFGSKGGLALLSEGFMNRLVSLLAPVKNTLKATEDKEGNYTLYGKKYTPTEFRLKWLQDMFVPMNFGNIYYDGKDEKVNKFMVGFNAAIGGTGVSVQNQGKYEATGSTNKSTNSRTSRTKNSRSKSSRTKRQ